MNMNKIEGTAFISYDMSGSIDNEKQAYYKKVYDYYNNLYKNVKVIKHTTVGKFSDIDDILNNSESGGTYISSGLKLAVGEVLARCNSLDKVILCGDGDNWSEDNDRVLNLIGILNDYCKIDYLEFLPCTYSTTMYDKLRKIYTVAESDNIKLYKITDKEQDIFGKKLAPRKESFNIAIHIDGNKTIAKTMDGKVGIATCNPNDEYNREEGIRVAVSRLLEIKTF